MSAIEQHSAATSADAVSRPFQRWRGWIALGEVLVVIAAVVLGVLCWRHGIVAITTPVPGGPPLVSTVFYGNWSSCAVGLVTVAAFLLLDAVRQTILAVRGRPS